MKNKKQLLSLILCALMLPIVSCSESDVNSDTIAVAPVENPEEETTSEVETVADAGAVAEDYNWQDNIRQENYDGHTFNILNGCTASWYSYTSIVPEEMTAEAVNDAFYERNLRVSEYLNVKIGEIHDGDSLNILKNAVTAGTQDFDVALVTLMNSYAVAMEGNIIYDFNKIEGLDMSTDWWDQNAINDLTINGQLYFATSSADTTRLDSIRALIFNKDSVAKYQLENPYDLVDAGTWTIDKFAEMCLAATDDTDGDGVMTDKDNYGVVCYASNLADYLLLSSGEKYIAKDSTTGMLIDGTAGEKFIDIYNKAYSIMYNSEGYVFDAHANTAYQRGLGDRIQEAIFMEGGSLFYMECLAWARAFRDMESDFGIVPPPKYDESQDRYYSYMLNPFMQMIPGTAENPVRTAHILDALAAASHDTVVPAYITTTLQGKVARDAETIRMINLVFDQLTYNLHFASISTRSVVTSALTSGNENLASALKSNAKAIKKQLEKTNAFFFPEEVTE